MKYCLIFVTHIVSLSIFYKYYFGRCSYKLVEMVPVHYLSRRSTHYANRLHVFSAIPNFIRKSRKSWLECIIQLAVEPRINRYLLFLGYFQSASLQVFCICLFILIIPCLWSLFRLVWIKSQLKKNTLDKTTKARKNQQQQRCSLSI